MPKPSSQSDPAWTAADLTNPHAALDKAGRVERMFSAIAPSYDLNNRLHSLGRDQAWRRAAVKMAEVKPNDAIVDVACGTGDLTLAFARQLSRLSQTSDLESPVLGIDFTYNMLTIAQHKAEKGKAEHASACVPPAATGGLPARTSIRWLNADAQRLPLPDACCDIVSIAFGIRNVTDPARALAEFHRILRPGGRLIVLEFSLPRNAILRAGYNLYFKHIMPRTASWIARDRSGAYRYLPQSVTTFITPPGMVTLFEQTGFTHITLKPLTCGIAVCYRGVRI